jgi:hypothetical protein
LYLFWDLSNLIVTIMAKEETAAREGASAVNDHLSGRAVAALKLCGSIDVAAVHRQLVWSASASSSSSTTSLYLPS